MICCRSVFGLRVWAVDSAKISRDMLLSCPCTASNTSAMRSTRLSIIRANNWVLLRLASSWRMQRFSNSRNERRSA